MVCQNVFSAGLGIRVWALTHEMARGPFPPSPCALNGFVAVVVSCSIAYVAMLN